MSHGVITKNAPVLKRHRRLMRILRPKKMRGGGSCTHTLRPAQKDWPDLWSHE